METTPDSSFWNSWWDGSGSRYNPLIEYSAVHRRFNRLYNRYLEKGQRKKIIELGCGGGSWLIYFAREFGYDVYGLDYSEQGVSLARRNLQSQGIKGTVICQDICVNSLEKESFDVVYSLGLIEHFQDPSVIIEKHFELLKPEGLLMISIPDLNDNLYHRICKILHKEDLLRMHNLELMDAQNLKRYVEPFGTILLLEHFGPINLNIVGMRSDNVMLNAALMLLNQALGHSHLDRINAGYLSPYLVMICRKERK